MSVVDNETVVMEANSRGQPTEVMGPEDTNDYDCHVPWVRPDKRLQRPLKQSVPELLALREGYGMRPLALPPFSRPRALMTSTLASKIAW
jgi:hypothetical protein